MMTGYGELINAAEEKVPGIDRILAKPFTTGALSRFVTDVLG